MGGGHGALCVFAGQQFGADHYGHECIGRANANADASVCALARERLIAVAGQRDTLHRLLLRISAVSAGQQLSLLLLLAQFQDNYYRFNCRTHAHMHTYTHACHALISLVLKC